MNLGKTILNIRKERNLTQEEFAQLFHVTRQTVSNWENEKSYPDLGTLVEISNQFLISLDKLIKEDAEMVKNIDKERMRGRLIRLRRFETMGTGAGVGALVSCLYAPDSVRRSIIIGVAVCLILGGWYLQSKREKEMMKYLE